MFLIYIFTFCFVFFLINDYKKAVITLCVFAVSLMFVQSKIIANNSSFHFLGLVAILIGLYKYGFRRIFSNPLSWCLILPLLSQIVTMWIYGRFIPSYLIRTSVIYLIPVILYLSLENKADTKYYIKCVKWYLVIIVLYSFYEEIVQYNPVMQYCAQNPDLFGWTTSRIDGESMNTMRFGMRRSQSLFGSEAAFAAVIIYYFFVIRKYQSDNNNLIERNVILFLTISIPFCVLFTGTRSAMLAFVIACVGLLSLKRIRRNWYYYAIALVVAFFMSSYLGSVIDSIINSSNSEIGGSTEEMREGQWEIALYYLAKNPICGNGVGFTASLIAEDEQGLFGAEGMWLTAMMDRGIVGVVSILFSYIIVIILLIKKKMYSAVWILLSFLVFKTITTVVGVSENYAILVAVFYIRYKEILAKTQIRTSSTWRNKLFR